MPDERLRSKYLRPFVMVLCYAQGLAHGDSSSFSTGGEPGRRPELKPAG